MDWAESIEEVLNTAREALDGIGEGEVRNERLHWLERQLANVLAQLGGMMADLESGLSVADMGFFGDEEFQGEIDDFGRQVANLRSMIRIELAVGR